MQFRLHRLAGLMLLGLLPAAGALGQDVVREQDELDFGRLNLALGSGARALGMGGAFLARPDDATAASWNPAGLSYLRLPEVSLVGIYVNATTERRGEGTLEKHDHLQGGAPDFGSLAVPITLGSVTGAVQLSFQRVIPFSASRRIDEVGDPPKVIDAHGGFDTLTLGTGLKVNRWLRLGATANRWFNGFHQHRERQVFRRSIQEVDFDLAGWTFNAGAIAQLSDTFNVGVVAKTHLGAGVTLARERNDYVSQPDGAPDVVSTNAFTSDAVTLDLPGAVGFGASWRPTSPLTLSADYTRTYWSHARIHNYFTLPPGPGASDLAPAGDCAAEPRPATCPEVFSSLLFPNVLDAAQSDTYEVRLGVEYVLIPGRVKVPVRAGYVTASQYRRDADGASPRYDGITAGLGLVVGPLLLDGAWVHQWGDFGPSGARTSTRLHYVLFSLIYRHGG